MSDVMGSRPMSDRQLKQAEALRQMFEQANAALTPPQGDATMTPEAGRLFAVARTQLELACLAAVKAVSRMSA